MKITKDTLIPISLVVVICGLVFGVSKTQARIDTNSVRLTMVEQSNKELIKKLDNIAERLAKIEGLLIEMRRKK